MRIETSLTRRLGIDLPIVQAGMSWASSCAALPLAVSRAGGLGVIAAGPMYEDALVRAIDDVRAGTDRPFAVNMPLYRQGAERVLDLLAEARVPVLVASQGGPKKYLDRFKALGTVCIHVVASVEHAVKAADAGVDALVVVGGEAGADGAGLAAALSLGAAAANFGTRFIATPEAAVSDAYKRMIVAAGPSATRTVGRDVGMIRALANEFTDAMQALELSGADVAVRKDRFQQSSLKMAALDGDIATGKVEAGQSAGLVDEIAPAAEVVRRIAEEYLAVVRRLPLPVGAHV